MKADFFTHRSENLPLTLTPQPENLPYKAAGEREMSHGNRIEKFRKWDLLLVNCTRILHRDTLERSLTAVGYS